MIAEQNREAADDGHEDDVGGIRLLKGPNVKRLENRFEQKKTHLGVATTPPASASGDRQVLVGSNGLRIFRPQVEHEGREEDGVEYHLRRLARAEAAVLLEQLGQHFFLLVLGLDFGSWVASLLAPDKVCNVKDTTG